MTNENKEDKRYGLIVPSKNRLSVPKPGNVFGEDSGSDADDGSDWVRKALRAEGEKNLVKKQTQLTMKRALKEDPTVYQYDEVYDTIERSKIEEKINKKTVEKKAKYIENLLKAAERRKREQEHRVERMVQKEREAEGAMFADKESFVTSAYRAKLEEFKKMEEEEKRMDRLEAIGDVTKQQDISGFYRHLYTQTVDVNRKDADETDKEVKKEADSANTEITHIEKSEEDQDHVDKDDPLTTDSEKNSDHENERNLAKLQKSRKTLAKGGSNRQYRKRAAEISQSSSEDECDNEEDMLKTTVAEKSEAETPEKLIKLSSDDGKLKTKDIPSDTNKADSDVKPEANISAAENSAKQSEDKLDAEDGVKRVKKMEPEAPKISIWQKRTVGPIFEAALERYYARKAARSSG
ncbi:nuclear speckle splicing regulatory protein 1 [Neodiprion lecontei]|uniref:Nuclear speckle splicing regulatory protein 1 n=1 Tax=Neodiprion lecontei TaxID=441921 RepID=A0A6J0BMA7_NEOLC|nr:nuclear speckle splicing regulatory protein 1 [Neodiprion lecontei]XP_046410348.1 nuclear speckle splicing regulatory protein 1 [Neodiprion fabricii]